MKKMYYFLIYSLFLFLAGCFSNQLSKKKTSEKAVLTTKTLPVEELVTNRQTYNPTFLDTINQGNELVLTEADLKKNSQTNEPVSYQTPSTTEIRYRVQVLASNRIDFAREQKKELEKKIIEDIIIEYEAPYYKVYVGSFLKRQDAYSLLQKIKKLGFSDAWIVTSGISASN